MIIDSHTHFDLLLEEAALSEEHLIEELHHQKIVNTVQVGIDLPSSEWSAGFARRHAQHGILYTIGIHPSSYADTAMLDAWMKFLVAQANSPDRELLFGVGECGLDFYRHRQPRDMQVSSFECQLAAARRHGLPIIIHSRDAMDDTIALLKPYAPVWGIMHCFPGSPTDARRVLDLGLYISFAGNVTYPKATILHESAAYVPSDRLLVETDAPFLTPVPLRGQKNRPAYILHTYRYIAGIRNQPVERFIEIIGSNFKTFRGHQHAASPL